MARNRDTKVGIDYFSHDTDILQDSKMRMIKATHGLIGYAVYLRLLEDLYREKGYYLDINDDVNILFCDDNNLTLNVYILVLNDCINRGLFNKDLYDKYGILTSKRIQKNYVAATERRREVSFYSEYLLIDVLNAYDTSKVNVNILYLNVNNLVLNTDISKQSKEKVKRKEIESKGNDIYVTIKTLSLTNPEYQKLIEAYPKKLVDDKIEYCKNYKGIEKKYNSLYLTINNWCKKDNAKEQPEENYFLSKLKESRNEQR